MLVAYLRGFLSPGYPNGLRSMLREDVLLKACSIQNEIEFEKLKLGMEAAFAARVDSKAAGKVVRQLYESIQRAKAIGAMDIFMRTVPKTLSSIDSVEKIYHAFEKAGLIVNKDD